MFVRGIRAVDVTQLALKTLVDDLVLLCRCEPCRVLVVVGIDEVEQRWKRCAELETQAAAVAQVIDTGEFVSKVVFDEVLRVERVIGSGHGAPQLGSEFDGLDAGSPVLIGQPASIQDPVVRALRALRRIGQRGSFRRVQASRAIPRSGRSLLHELFWQSLGTSRCTRRFLQQLQT